MAKRKAENETQVTGSTVYNIRLPREELATLEQEASKEGLIVAEYLRKSAALHPTKSVLAKPQYGIIVSTPYFQLGAVPTWSENLASVDLKITQGVSK